MAYDDKGWKRRIINAVFFVAGGWTIWVFKKMVDYRNAFDELEDENPSSNPEE